MILEFPQPNPTIRAMAIAKAQQALLDNAEELMLESPLDIQCCLMEFRDSARRTWDIVDRFRYRTLNPPMEEAAARPIS